MHVEPIWYQRQIPYENTLELVIIITTHDYIVIILVAYKKTGEQYTTYITIYVLYNYIILYNNYNLNHSLRI